MMEKSALAGEGRGAIPPPFSLLPSLTKLQCMPLRRGQIHSFYFISALYVLRGSFILVLQHLLRSSCFSSVRGEYLKIDVIMS